MTAVGMILLILGGIVSVGGSIWFLIEAFKESPMWGLGCIFIPFMSLIFLVLHWDAAAKPFGVSVAGSLLMCVAAMFLGGRPH